jgi:dienelactone hydrolase
MHSGIAACISREFEILSSGKTSRITAWLRALAKAADSDCGNQGVGVIGLCFTGGFALATVLEPTVRAPVVCEPSLPVALPWNRKVVEADLGLCDADLKAICNRLCKDNLKVLGYRFSCDRISPAARFDTLRRELGSNFVGTEIPSCPGNPSRIPPNAHSVLTLDRKSADTQEALERVIEFLEESLKRH